MAVRSWFLALLGILRILTTAASMQLVRRARRKLDVMVIVDGAHMAPMVLESASPCMVQMSPFLAVLVITGTKDVATHIQIATVATST